MAHPLDFRRHRDQRRPYQVALREMCTIRKVRLDPMLLRTLPAENRSRGKTQKSYRWTVPGVSRTQFADRRNYLTPTPTGPPHTTESNESNNESNTETPNGSTARKILSISSSFAHDGTSRKRTASAIDRTVNCCRLPRERAEVCSEDWAFLAPPPLFQDKSP